MILKLINHKNLDAVSLEFHQNGSISAIDLACDGNREIEPWVLAKSMRAMADKLEKSVAL